MHKAKQTQQSTTDRKTAKVARVYTRLHRKGSCPRCGSGRPCFIRSDERVK